MCFLRRTGLEVSEEARTSGALPPCPAPWKHEAEATVVSVASWLNPEVQVPNTKGGKEGKEGKESKEKEDTRETPGPTARLEVAVSLYAKPLEEVVESEEEAAAPPQAKAKAKAKGKK